MADKYEQGVATLKQYSKIVDPSYHYQQMVDSKRIEDAVLPPATVHREAGGEMEVADK